MERLRMQRVLPPPHHQEIVPGVYYGLAKHIDGTLIPVKLEISRLDTKIQPTLFSICIGFDRANDYGISQSLPAHMTSSADDGMPMAGRGDGDNLHSTSSIGNGCPTAPVLLGKKVPAVANHLAASLTSGLLENGMGTGHVDSPCGLVMGARFSIGGGTMRECDSDSAVDFIAPSCSTTIAAVAAAEQHRSCVGEVDMKDASLGTLEDENNEAVRGEYSKYYDTFQLIGNGAFGSVKLAARKDSGLLAVSKFVCKAKVLPESWVPSPKRGHRMVPIEVHLLENLNHPNIVKVLDVFENENYYQLVMEKLGCGMDLFEFIENHPTLDESLISFIFRQIVSAVDYLHENGIVHRDLKDENVIIDQNFTCKLIDFGSAAFFGENVVFSTFCGTMEYCSPEVLTGNKYLGPELEMWSLGILLYTLVFYENPFRTPQETIRADFCVHWNISEGLYQVLGMLLQPDPKLRATVGELKRHWWVTQKVDPKMHKFSEILKNAVSYFPPQVLRCGAI
ncbi:unnamed protein product [Sphagnum compactum]